MRGFDVGRSLRVIRTYANKNQAQVADHIPMAVSTLSDIERGATLPSNQTILEITDVCGGTSMIDRLISDMQRLKDANHAIRSTNKLLYGEPDNDNAIR